MNALIRLLAVLVLLPGATPAFAQSGTLVIVGGGDVGPDIVSRMLDLAGGKNAIVAILPQASSQRHAGDSAVKMWHEAGVREATTVRLDDRDAAIARLKRATLIWIPGGDQNRLMKAVESAAVAEVIRECYRGGTVVAGSSAGAAVMSDAMITGDADLTSITAGRTRIGRGLALWPDAIVDQHFLKRQRSNRLIGAVLDHPELVGVGIDESTAVIVKGRGFEVIGRSSAVVVDARRARVDQSAPGSPASGRGLLLTVLHAGQAYSLD